MALLGVRQIEMYGELIKGWFKPVIAELDGRTATVEQEIRTQAKRTWEFMICLPEKLLW